MSPTVGSLFSGIGAMDYALERAGWTIQWQIENDPYATKVLEKHWPNVERYGDITTVDFRQLPRVDLLAGGAPCQPVSYAGKRKAQDDARWLWPEFARAIRDLRPSLVLLENVPGLLRRGFSDVLWDLAACGYNGEWESLPAAQFGALHYRLRIWLVAYPQCDEPERGGGSRLLDPTTRDDQAREEERQWIRNAARNRGPVVAHPDRPPANRGRSGWAVDDRDPGEAESRIRRVSHGPTPRVDGDLTVWDWGEEWAEVPRTVPKLPHRADRLRGLGNAVVVPQVEWIGRQLYRKWQEMHGQAE